MDLGLSGRVKIKYTSLKGTSLYRQFSLDPGVKTYANLIKLIQQEIRSDEDLSISYLARDKYGEQSQCFLHSDIDLHKAMSQCTDLTLRLFIEAKPKPDESWDIVSNDELVVSHNDDASVTRGISKDCTSPLSLSPQFAAPFASTSTGYLVSSIRSALIGGSFLQNVSQQLVKTVSSFEKVINFKNDITSRPSLSEAEFRGFMDSLGRIVNPLDFYQNVYLRGIEPSLRRVAWRILLNIYPAELDGKERMALLQSKIERYELMKETWKRAYREGRLTNGQINSIALACVDVVRTDRTHPFYHNDGKNQRVSQLFNILATYAIHHPGIGYHQGMSNLASLLLYVQDSEGAAYACFCSLMQRLAPKFSPQHDQITMISQMQHLHDLLVFTDSKVAQFLGMHNLGNMFFTERWLLLELIREFPFELALQVSEVQWAAIALVAASWPGVGSTSKCSHLTVEQRSVDFADGDMHYAQCDANLINSLVGVEYRYNPSRADLGQAIEQSRTANPIHEGDPVHTKDWVVELPPPDTMGGGSNPFLLFICVSMILEYREDIFEQVREVCDLFHLFQTYEKRHNLVSILNRARSLFDAYLRDQEIKRRSIVIDRSRPKNS